MGELVHLFPVQGVDVEARRSLDSVQGAQCPNRLSFPSTTQAWPGHPPASAHLTHTGRLLRGRHCRSPNIPSSSLSSAPPSPGCSEVAMFDYVSPEADTGRDRDRDSPADCSRRRGPQGQSQAWGGVWPTLGGRGHRACEEASSPRVGSFLSFLPPGK